MESVALVRQLTKIKNVALDVAFILPEPSSTEAGGIGSGSELSSSAPDAQQQYQKQSSEISEGGGCSVDEEAKDSSSYIRRTLSGRSKSKWGGLFA